MVRSPRNGTERSPWAVKKVNKRFYDSDYERRLHDEATILKRLTHPHIVGFRAFVKSQDGVKCLAMEECQISLGDLLLETPVPLPAASILKVCFDIAKALDYLHNEQFILHGDVKSYNILIKGIGIFGYYMQHTLKLSLKVSSFIFIIILQALFYLCCFITVFLKI